MSRARRNILPVDLTPSSDFLVAGRGEPVWPVRGDGEKEALLKIAALFKARIEPAAGSPGQTRPGAEEVVGMGAAVADSAKLYAHLTCRQFRPASHEADVMRQSPPAVLVTTLSALTPALMQWLYSDTGRSAPGIVCAPDEARLRTQVLVRAAAALLEAPDNGRTDVFPNIPFGHVAAPEHVVLGRDSQAPDLRSALSGGASLLTIATHADGIDAHLGPDLTLCAMSRSEEHEAGQAVPVCRVTNFCHRLGRPLPEALGSGLLLFPAAIAARILVFSVCSGVLLAGSPVDADRGLAPQFFENPSLGAIVTTSELTFLEPGDLEFLLADIERGLPIGRAVARFNRSPIARRNREHLCLFGDPRTRSGPGRPRARAVEVQPSFRSTALRRAGRMQELAELAFARAGLTLAITSLSARVKGDGPGAGVQQKLQSAWKALNAIQVFEHMAWTLDGAGQALDLAGQAVRDALIEDAHNRGMFINDWFALVRIDKLRWRARRCCACGQSAKTAEAEVRVPGVSRRRLGVCARCGITEDISLRLDLSFAINRQTGEVRLQTPAPVSGWSAALQIHSKYRPYCRTWQWPAAADGRPQEIFQSPVPWPPGPLRVSFVMIHMGAVSSVGQEIYNVRASD